MASLSFLFLCKFYFNCPFLIKGRTSLGKKADMRVDFHAHDSSLETWSRKSQKPNLWVRQNSTHFAMINSFPEPSFLIKHYELTAIHPFSMKLKEFFTNVLLKCVKALVYFEDYFIW